MNTWTEEKIELLTKLWKEGLSASVIAAQLGEGLTRNAVIGKVHRLKLAGTARPARPRAAKAPRTSVSRTPSVPRRKAAKALAGALDRSFANAEAANAAPEIPFVLPVTQNYGSSRAIVGLQKDTCKWPFGDPRSEDFRFCGCPSEDNSPYCSHHRQDAVDRNHRRRLREFERLAV